MQMLGGNRDAQPAQENAPQGQSKQPASTGGGSDDMQDDIPFMNPYKFNWRML